MILVLIIIIILLIIYIVYEMAQKKAINDDLTEVATAASNYVNATNNNAIDAQNAAPLVKVLTNLNTIAISNSSGTLVSA